jgi:hypothetical protein
VTLLTQLKRDTAARNAVIPFVLRRGCASYPDMESLSTYLEELYGARVEPTIRKKGEIQCLGFTASFSEERFLPERADLLSRIAALLGEMLLSPNTRGGLLLPAYVDSERDKLIERIDAAVNDKRSYSLRRLFELMCPCEDYATDRLGSREEAEGIGYVKLTRQYRELLATSPVEIFYCGSASPAEAERAVKSALLTMPRGEPDLELGTDIRMNTMEEGPRRFTEFVLVHCRRGGGLRVWKDLGDEVAAGEVIGEVVDVFGQRIEEITAPVAGFIFRVMRLGSVSTGAEVVWLAR